jgi:hypothetical protein
MPGARQRAREDTWGRLLAPARPAQTPLPALRRSHFPDPPSTTLRQQSQPILLVVPGALHHRRTAAVVKRSLLDDGEDRHTLFGPGMTLLTQRGAMSGRVQTAAQAAAWLPGSRALPHHRILVFGACWGRPAEVPDSGPLAHHSMRDTALRARSCSVLSRRSANQRRTSWPQDWPSRCPSGAGMVSG